MRISFDITRTMARGLLLTCVIVLLGRGMEYGRCDRAGLA
jgi:hypothetical protein